MLRHMPVVVLLCLLPATLVAETKTATPAAKGRDDPDRVICRRESITGSLVQTRKVCMTRADWIARSRGAQEAGQQMQDAGRINSCGATEPGRC
ncbi:hypothetical protein [Sphingomonas sp. SUN039]|uniref:hypothetical protein n=1 Tax=Sphingomonas sp. SUN039 TaxID=2937787 RepID=UPI002164DEB0|nr:hypothetical protein [Sphingomonas sp. SUN039]UVO54923.1 hypothetical protein M0209_12610 [Sphingomonas sp. SUN039]